MGRSLSLDLRERVVRFVELGNSRRAAGRHFQVSHSTAIRLMSQKATTGTISPKPQGRRREGKLTPALPFLIEIVESVPDITLVELAAAVKDEYDISASLPTLSRALTSAGYSFKKRRFLPRSGGAKRSAEPAATGSGADN